MPAVDSYSVASGKAIYGGRTAPSDLPAWLPASLVMSPVSLNTMSSVFDTGNSDPRLRGSNWILDAWCSTVPCPDWGTLGGIACFGGGHQNYVGNEVYMYDVALRTFSRISDGTPIPISSLDYDTVAGNNPAGAIANRWGEYWTSTARDAVIVGKTAPPHTYSNILHVPGSAVGNVQGWLMLIGGFSYQNHYIDLDNPSIGWRRNGPMYLDIRSDAQVPAYGCSFWDSIRQRVICFPFNGGANPFAYSFAVPSGDMTVISANYVNSYYTIGFHDVLKDLYIVSRMGDVSSEPWAIFVHDPATGAKTAVTHTGNKPAYVQTLEFDPDTRQLVGWMGGADPTLYVCQLPANPKTEPWVWSSSSYTNTDTVIVQQSNDAAMYKRLHYSPRLGAYLLIARVNGAVQCWRK